MAPGQVAQFGRKGEDDMEVTHRKRLGNTGCDPVGRLRPVTLGTGPAAAGEMYPDGKKKIRNQGW